MHPSQECKGASGPADAEIALNHMQLVALAASFPLQWPEIVEALFTTFGVLGDAGDYLCQLTCADPDAEMEAAASPEAVKVLLMPFMAIFGRLSGSASLHASGIG